jgi:hypothetical protein
MTALVEKQRYKATACQRISVRRAKSRVRLLRFGDRTGDRQAPFRVGYLVEKLRYKATASRAPGARLNG